MTKARRDLYSEGNPLYFLRGFEDGTFMPGCWVVKAGERTYVTGLIVSNEKKISISLETQKLFNEVVNECVDKLGILRPQMVNMPDRAPGARDPYLTYTEKGSFVQLYAVIQNATGMNVLEISYRVSCALAARRAYVHPIGAPSGFNHVPDDYVYGIDYDGLAKAGIRFCEGEKKVKKKRESARERKKRKKLRKEKDKKNKGEKRKPKRLKDTDDEEEEDLMTMSNDINDDIIINIIF
eukprot:gb/GEZN01006768.1/.p1 GENE.gb/GEZN01006768.1/~~gb/GEZN01006768.1/.p1  ORF type:complete len:238 (-),score=23.18 gb/GEZN01006768.1/:252-965(-)